MHDGGRRPSGEDDLQRKTTFGGRRPSVEDDPQFFWHKCAAFQRSAVGRSTAGSDVVATILISLFSSPLLAFFTEGVLGSKNLFSES